MISTSNVVAIDCDELYAWLRREMAPFFDPNVSIYWMPRPNEAKGESRFFCNIDVERSITLSDLCALAIAEHSTDQSIYFYVDDVVEAAVSAGELSGDHFWLYYKW